MARVVLIGGLDPSGGAGLLRDHWTVRARAPSVEIHAVCSALTRQGEGGPARVASPAAATIEAELDRIAKLDDVAAVKLGMIPAAALDPVIACLARLRARPRGQRPWVVVDPVVTASAGGRLGAPVSELLRLAEWVDLLTPNRDEQAALSAAGELPGSLAWLFKSEPVANQPEWIRDRLVLADRSEHSFDRPRQTGPDPRGTGCALASAIAAELSSGRGLVEAVAAAICWLDEARLRATRVAHEWHLPIR